MIDNQGFRANVAMIICNHKGQVLWCQRANSDDAWQFPQGGIQVGESAEQAMFRELEEEVGLNKDAVSIIATNKNWLRYRLPIHLQRKKQMPKCIGQKQRWFLLSLDVSDQLIDLNRSVPAEFTEWRWVSYWYPINQVVEFKRDVYRRGLKSLMRAHGRFIRESRIH